MGLPRLDDGYLYGIGGSLSSAAMQMEAQDASITTKKIQPVKKNRTFRAFGQKRKKGLKQHTELNAAIFFIPSS